jgi:hypothetical protein
MTMVLVTHAVGNMDTWLKGGEHCKGVFSKFLLEPSNLQTRRCKSGFNPLRECRPGQNAGDDGQPRNRKGEGCGHRD